MSQSLFLEIADGLGHLVSARTCAVGFSWAGYALGETAVEEICEECGFYHLFASYHHLNHVHLSDLARLYLYLYLSRLSGLVCLAKVPVCIGRYYANDV